MNKIKTKDLRQLPVEELQNKLIEIRKELMRENAQVAMRTIPKNPGLIKANKKMVARIFTLLKEKNLTPQISKQIKKLKTYNNKIKKSNKKINKKSVNKLNKAEE